MFLLVPSTPPCFVGLAWSPVVVVGAWSLLVVPAPSVFLNSLAPLPRLLSMVDCGWGNGAVSERLMLAKLCGGGALGCSLCWLWSLLGCGVLLAVKWCLAFGCSLVLPRLGKEMKGMCWFLPSPFPYAFHLCPFLIPYALTTHYLVLVHWSKVCCPH